jgi:hypothetical protein
MADLVRESRLIGSPPPVLSSRRNPRKKRGAEMKPLRWLFPIGALVTSCGVFLGALDDYLSFQERTFKYSPRFDARLSQPIGRGRLGCAGEGIQSLAVSRAFCIASARQAARRGAPPGPSPAFAMVFQRRS